MTLQTTITIILQISGILGALGVFFGGGGYLISKYKGGTREEKEESADIISSNDQIKQFFKDQNEDYKLIIKEQGVKIEGLTREIGEIRGQLNAETNQKKEYLAILENRDPAMKASLDLLVQSVKDQQVVNKEIVRILGEIHSMAKDEHERDFQITSTVTKTDHS